MNQDLPRVFAHHMRGVYAPLPGPPIVIRIKLLRGRAGGKSETIAPEGRATGSAREQPGPMVQLPPYEQRFSLVLSARYDMLG